MNGTKVTPQTKKELVWTVAPEQQVSDLDRVMEIGKMNDWDFRVCGRGKMMTSPVVHESGWILVPIDQDNSIIPIDALQRLWAIQKANIRIDGIFIGHEPKPDVPIEYQAPAILPESVPSRKQVRKSDIPPKKKPQVTKNDLVKAGVNIAKGTGKVGLEAAKIGGKIIIGTALVIGSVAAGIGNLLLLDPTINIVLSEPGKPWVELVYWYE